MSYASGEALPSCPALLPKILEAAEGSLSFYSESQDQDLTNMTNNNSNSFLPNQSESKPNL